MYLNKIDILYFKFKIKKVLNIKDCLWQTRRQHECAS